MALLYALPALTNSLQGFLPRHGQDDDHPDRNLPAGGSAGRCGRCAGPARGADGHRFACAFGWCVMLAFEVPYYFWTCKKQKFEKGFSPWEKLSAHGLMRAALPVLSICRADAPLIRPRGLGHLPQWGKAFCVKFPQYLLRLIVISSTKCYTNNSYPCIKSTRREVNRRARRTQSLPQPRPRCHQRPDRPKRRHRARRSRPKNQSAAVQNAAAAVLCWGCVCSAWRSCWWCPL